ncbi:MAG TPA: efflux RND transporter periplasmic adaptor subunit [Armatimonadota bacterium]|jgi:RND family efflux transporter MFP subunit
MKRSVKVALLLALVGLIALVVAVGRRRGAPEAAPEASSPLSVRVLTVGRRDLTQMIEVAGAIKPQAELNLTALASGVVTGVSVTVGQRVAPGQVLLEVDPSQAEAQLRQAEGAAAAAAAKVRQAEKGQPLQKARATSNLEQARQGVAAARAQLQKARLGADLQVAEGVSDLARAEAGVDAARAQLAAARRGPRPQQLRQAEAQARQAQAGYDAAKRQLDRAQFLYDHGGFTGAQLEGARTDAETALAGLDSAKEQLSLARAGAAPEEIAGAEAQARQAEAARDLARDTQRKRRQVAQQDVRAAETQLRQAESGLRAARAGTAEAGVAAEDVLAAQGALEQARSGLALARLQLGMTRVTSPVSGTVSTVHVHVGEAVGPGAPVVTLLLQGAPMLEAKLSPRDRAFVPPGAPAAVLPDATPGVRLLGRVATVAPAAEPGSDQFALRIALPRAADSTALGGFARARLPGRRVVGALAVPRSALVEEAGKASVLAVRDGQARRTPVSTGLRASGWVEVTAGVHQGDVLVASPTLVSDGQAVRAETPSQ